jgi:SAM-dependent methyltransferase
VTAPARAAAEPVYPAEVSDLYEFFYRGRGKDFAGEAAAVAALVRAAHPRAASVLDVACGPGAHLRELAAWFGDVAGQDASPSMCALARERVPGAQVHRCDLRDFDLGRTFSAVTCLTSTLGYMADAGELDAAVATMARHLEPGGVLVIDPWWTPEQFVDGYTASDLVREGDRAVARVSHSARDGSRVRNEAQYLVAGTEGIRHLTHVQELSLFTREQYLAALERAGCAAEHVAGLAAFPDRGLYVGRTAERAGHDAPQRPKE